MDTVSIHELVFDVNLNPRQRGVDQEVVEYYATIFKEVIWPPVMADRATRKLLDGWHRVEAAKRAGVYTIAVQWVDAKEEDLFPLAVKFNLAHGVHLSKEERLKAIIRMMREGWTHERVAEFLGCSMGLVASAEKADDLRGKLKVHDLPGAALPMETLAEVAKLDYIFHEEIAELACDVEAKPGDVRRTVRAIKKGDIESDEEIRRTMTDPEYLKARANALPALEADGDWMMTFATLVDRMETRQLTITPLERDAAVALFHRMRTWADRQLALLGAEE